jgi:hypothetical protein
LGEQVFEWRLPDEPSVRVRFAKGGRITAKRAFHLTNHITRRALDPNFFRGILSLLPSIVTLKQI